MLPEHVTEARISPMNAIFSEKRTSTLFFFLLVFALVLPVSADDAEEEKLLVEPVSVQTKDRVGIRGVYYESSKAKENGKQVIPIIMLHGYEGAGAEYTAMAKYLQGLGHSVVTVDLRGHGRSLVRKVGDADMELELDRFRKPDFEAMIMDVQAIKQFLIEKHNEGKCNIELLTLMGAEMGGIVAVQYAAYDWSRRNPPSKVYKLGQDVCGLILLSPLNSFREGGTSMGPALRQVYVATKMPIMIVAGKQDRRGFRESEKVHKAIDQRRGRPSKDPGEIKKRALIFAEVPTSLQGAMLVNPQAKLQVPKYINSFLNQLIAPKQAERTWTKRGT